MVRTFTLVTILPTWRAASAIAVALVAVALAGCSPSATPDGGGGATDAGLFANVDNTPFATRTLGPRGALCYEVEEVSGRSACEGGWSRALPAARAASDADACSGFVDFLVRNGLKPAGTRFLPSRRAVPVHEGQVVFPSLSEASPRAEGDLTFRVEGFSTSETALLQGILAEAYPVCRTYYGAPAFAHQVTVRLAPSLSNLAEGLYDAGTDTIELAPLSDNDRNTEFALVRHILHAMRDDAMLLYDAWEEGQALAVANLVLRDLEPDWDPTLDRPDYNLNLYELLNAPELGSDAIWNSGFAGLVVPRLGMSSGAWLKLLVEDPRALARFNQAYYPLFAADPSVAGDVPRLLSVLAGAVASVEGRDLWEWYRGQYALDTSATVGQRVYIGMIPTYTAVALFVTNAVVGSDGQEAGRGGTATLEFWDYTHTYSLFVQEGYEIPIADSGSRAGMGEYSGSLYNIGGAQRITIDVVLGSVARSVVYPYMSRREDLDYQADPNGINLYGALVGRDDGAISVSIDGGAAEEVTLAQGAFRGHFGEGFIQPGKLAFDYVDPSGGEYHRTFNTGYFDYAILGDLGERGALTHTFPATASGLHLVALPAKPLASDEATVFGIPREQLLLATWQPELAGEDKYRIYPDLPPMAPGIGYWLRASGALTLDAAFDLPDTTQPYRVRLAPGWNLVGLPSTATYLPASLRFDQGSDAVTLTTAIQNGWIRGTLYRYDGDAGSYTEATEIPGWEGFWIRCLSSAGCNMVFFSGSVASALAQPRTMAERLRALGAEVAVVEIAGAGSRAQVTLGRLSSARDDSGDAWDAEAAPAPPGGGLTAGVVRAGGPLAVDLAPGTERQIAVHAPGGGPLRLRVLEGSLSYAGRVLATGDSAEAPTGANGGALLEVTLP